MSLILWRGEDDIGEEVLLAESDIWDVEKTPLIGLCSERNQVNTGTDIVNDVGKKTIQDRPDILNLILLSRYYKKYPS